MNELIIYTLNKPTTPYDIMFNRNKKNDKQIDIRSKKDIVSVLKPLENKNSNDIYILTLKQIIYTENIK